MKQPNDVSVIAVPVTPFKVDGSIEFDALPRLLGILTDSGVHTAAINGNTAEFYALTSDERRELCRASAAAAGDDLELIVGIGGDLPTAIAEGHVADEHGAVGVMVHQPPHPYVSLEGWVDYHVEIASALPSMSLIPYVRSPRVTGRMIREVADRTGAVSVVKYAVPNPDRLAAEIDECGDESIRWVCGLAERWAPFFALSGTVGFTSGLVDVAPGISVSLGAALASGDFADAMTIWRRLRPFEELRARHGDANNVAVIKEALHIIGACERHVRRPATELADAERREVADLLPSLLLELVGQGDR